MRVQSSSNVRSESFRFFFFFCNATAPYCTLYDEYIFRYDRNAETVDMGFPCTPEIEGFGQVLFRPSPSYTSRFFFFITIIYRSRNNMIRVYG